MDESNKAEISIIFSQGHNEQLVVEKDKKNDRRFSLLRQVLSDKLKYVIKDFSEPLTSIAPENTQILVIGAPEDDLTPEEIKAIKEFIEGGGGLLLISNADTIIKPSRGLNETAGTAGIQFQEYHNYPPTFLQVFTPHYITANVKRIKIGRIASLTVNSPAHPLAFTKATRKPVMAGANVGKGRIVTIGDSYWLTDDLLNSEDNENLATNLFQWLAGRNVVDIEELDIPETVKWGQTAQVTLQLSNPDQKARPQVECVLESYVGADISGTARKISSIPYGEPTCMKWKVHPQTLGDQRLRLAIYAVGDKSLNGDEQFFFDQLPELRCEAPGYFTLEIKNKKGELQTAFQTGEEFFAEGAFHLPMESGQISYKLDLQVETGLVERGHEHVNGIDRWRIQTAVPGEHELTLHLVESAQSLPALVKVKPSIEKRLEEIKAAYVLPLEAEITERLRQFDEKLVHNDILQKPFVILPPKEFVESVYREDVALWLQEVIESAQREQWYNLPLLDIILRYIAPTYVPNCGSFIPYTPDLASHLSGLHSGQRRYLEYNLLCSEENEDVQIKPHIASYLLHEKFGHGFFYNQTRLGRQLAILQRHGFPEKPDNAHYTHYRKAAKLIEDSAIIANEGFAAWLELTFLGKLDRVIRQSVSSRWIYLIQESTGLYALEQNSNFFQTFPSRFDSRYRESFEDLDFISRKFSPHCALRVFLLATDIDFGITEDEHGDIQFAFEAERIEHWLLEEKKQDWRCHFRLREMADLIQYNVKAIEMLTRQQHCPVDCKQSGCPIEDFISSNYQGGCYGKKKN